MADNDVNESGAHELAAQLKPWIKEQIDAAVEYLGKKGAFESAFIEAKPAWTVPRQVLIGKAREHGERTDFRWFICGNLPFDHVGSEAAASPRAAARHFALKWQLDAARMAGAAGEELAQHAEALYALADDDGLWAERPE